MKLNTRWVLPVYPVCKDEKANLTNIIATNFIWEQLKTFYNSKY